MESKPKSIVVIVGQTASGKSAAAMKLTQEYNSEIIAADSRTVYKGMDIGTAKPSVEDQAKIPHHGLDLITPDQTFSAAQFQRYARKTVKEIQARGKLPIIVGGTGLYIDGFVYGFDFAARPNPKLRAKLASLNLNELQILAQKKDIDSDRTSYKNPRHLARAIEREGHTAQRTQKPKNIQIFGLKIGKEELNKRIAKRVDTMFNQGLVKEVQNLINLYGPEAPGLLAPGYKAVEEHLKGGLNLEDAKQLSISYDRRLAKRQQTWFKRNQDIVWFDNEQQVMQNVRDFLTKFATIES